MLLASLGVPREQYHLGDALGSVRQLANASGAVTLARAYQPFGSTLTTAGSATTIYHFTGEQRDGTGLVYLRARYYAPAQGRFIARDVRESDYTRPITLSTWLYGQANPVNWVDHTGQIAQNEAATADDLRQDLLATYGVEVVRDWGWPIAPLPVPEPCDVRGTEWSDGRWTLIELSLVEFAVERLAAEVGTPGSFQRLVGFVRIEKSPYACGRGCTTPPILLSPTTISLRDAGMPPSPNADLETLKWNEGVNFDAWSVVHELGHAWDFLSNREASIRLQADTGGRTDAAAGARKRASGQCDDAQREPGCNWAGYFYGGKPAAGSDANFSAQEDFAESVAAFAFPDIGPLKVAKYVRTEYETLLWYNNYKATPRWQFIKGLAR